LRKRSSEHGIGQDQAQSGRHHLRERLRHDAAGLKCHRAYEAIAPAEWTRRGAVYATLVVPETAGLLSV
jgi:hypothetical protein